MANEISFRFTLAAHAVDAGVGLQLDGPLTYGGANYIQSVQEIDTSAELVNIGDVTGAQALVILKNKDATNFCTLYADGAAGAKPVGILNAGQFAVLMSNATPAIGAKANTLGIQLEVLAIEGVTGTLAVSRPLLPTVGTATASLVLSASLGTSSVSVADEFTVSAITGAATLPLVLADTGLARCWTPAIPDSAATGLVAVRVSENLPVMVSYDTNSTDPFAKLTGTSDFVFLPLNGTVYPYLDAITGASTPVVEVITVTV